MDWLRRYRIEIKYILITGVLLAGMGALGAFGVLDGVERQVNGFMNRMVEWGMVGLFFAGLVANVTLVFMIPYALPLFTLSVYADSTLQVIALGAVAGIGAGTGATISYAVAHSLVSRVDDLDESALFRWTKHTIERRPWTIPVLVWLATATPAPDVVVLVPLAMIRYPWRKLVLPFLGGKVLQNVVMALVYRYGANRAESLLSTDINFDLTASITAIFVMLILYQIEKARQERPPATSSSEPDTISQQTPPPAREQPGQQRSQSKTPSTEVVSGTD